MEDNGEADTAVDIVGWRKPLVGEGLGHGGDTGGEAFDDPSAGLGGSNVLADRDEPGVSGRGDGVAAEAVDGDVEQSAGITDDETVPQQAHLDGKRPVDQWSRSRWISALATSSRNAISG